MIKFDKIEVEMKIVGDTIKEGNHYGIIGNKAVLLGALVNYPEGDEHRLEKTDYLSPEDEKNEEKIVGYNNQLTIARAKSMFKLFSKAKHRDKGMALDSYNDDIRASYYLKEEKIIKSMIKLDAIAYYKAEKIFSQLQIKKLVPKITA